MSISPATLASVAIGSFIVTRKFVCSAAPPWTWQAAQIVSTPPITWPLKKSLLQVTGGSVGVCVARCVSVSVPFACTEPPLSFALPVSDVSDVLPFQPKTTPLSLEPVSLKCVFLTVPVT